MFQEADDWAEHIRILKTAIDMFVPHVDRQMLEESFFSQVLPKTVKLFDDMMCELTSQAKGLSSQNLEIQTTLRNILQTMVQLLGALTGCVQHVCATQESVVLEHIHSLPSSVLRVIKSTFVHCKNSESVYSGRLHLVSDLLQALFKEAYSLQKQLLELLDMVCVEPGADDNDGTVGMVLVIHSLLDICSVISGMDHAFHANTWKFIIKQSLKHQSVLKSQLEHRAIVTSLCEDMLSAFHSCLQLAEQMAQATAPVEDGATAVRENADYKLFQKTLKLCRFFANSLLHYTKEFLPFLADSCYVLHRLYLQIHSKFPPSLYAPSISRAQQDEVAATFLVTLDALLGQLLPFQPFVQTVLDSTSGLPAELQLPHCLLLVVLMDKLPSQPEAVQGLWCGPPPDSETTARPALVRALFCSFERCSGELSLPVHMQGAEGQGQPEAAVTLYQHVCVHLCAFIASSHSSFFPTLDAALLAAVLGTQMIAALLAVDAWCFLARFGTAELCAHHVTVVAHLVRSCPGPCHQLASLSLLLQRLLFFMTPAQQARFVQQFPPWEAENWPLWQHVSFRAFSAELRRDAAVALSQAGVLQCRQWLGGRRTLAELDTLDAALSALLAVCSSAGDALDAGQQAAVVEVGSQLWTCLSSQQVMGHPRGQHTLGLLLPLLGLFIPKLDLQLISRVLTAQAVLLRLAPPDHVRLAVPDFVSSLGRLVIPEDAQDLILPGLAAVLALLLADGPWLLEQQALEAFTRFAEGTSHEEVVPQCLRAEGMKARVVAFLEKSGLREETAAARLERVKREKCVYAAPLAAGAAAESPLEPPAKRACPGLPEATLRAALQAASQALDTLESLLCVGPAPGWVAAQLTPLLRRAEALGRLL
ncbi:FIGNL1-interacting regulator of recombination and mitosis [Sorex fumeus]|uniref:FIGNL1-interacting regulator of recombination and mitosis n=1 Tax=Sorex fumeus TaxID=62283 RepID=UPI0024AD37F2|nr:FIGNL1-interacting regulator of recombination and mitosis [Sorex fumeus]